MGVASGVGVPQVRWTGWFMEHPAQKWIFMRDSTILGNLHIWLYVYIMSYNLYYYIYIISINTIYCYTISFILSMLAWQFEHLELDHRIYLYLWHQGWKTPNCSWVMTSWNVPGAGFLRPRIIKHRQRYFRSNVSSTLTIPNISKSLSEDLFEIPY